MRLRVQYLHAKNKQSKRGYKRIERLVRYGDQCGRTLGIFNTELSYKLIA
jgi:hypothetical protein